MMIIIFSFTIRRDIEQIITWEQEKSFIKEAPVSHLLPSIHALKYGPQDRRTGTLRGQPSVQWPHLRQSGCRKPSSAFLLSKGLSCMGQTA